MELFLDVLSESFVDTVKMLPFLFLAYLFIEYVEHRHGERIEAVLESSGRWGAIPALTEPMRVTARTRYHQTEQPATVYPAGEDGFRLEFDEPQRAPTAGQAVVLYQGDVVLGGGTIKSVEK